MERQRRRRAASLAMQMQRQRQEMERQWQRRQSQEMERQRRRQAASLAMRIKITLPDEILEMVLLRVNSILDVVSFSLTSWKWYHLVRSAAFWQLQPACGKNFVLFCSAFYQVWQKYLVPSSSWNRLDTDMVKMFNLGANVNVQIGVVHSNGILCKFPSLNEFYIVDPVNFSVKAHLMGPPELLANRRERLLFNFDSLTNNYTLVLVCEDMFVDYVSTRGWKWKWNHYIKGIILRESYLILRKFLYFLTKSKEEEGLQLCRYSLRTGKHVQKKASFIELEGMTSFSFLVLFANKRKLMLLGASSLMLRVWTVHEEKDGYIFKFDSTFQLAREHKGCKLSSVHDLVIVQYCYPSSVIAYCPSTSEWQYIKSPHKGAGVACRYYALPSKIFPNYFQQQVGIKKAEMSMEFLGAREE